MADKYAGHWKCGSTGPSSANQGPWGTCAIFATMKAIADEMERSYNIDLDVQKNAENIATCGITKASDGKLIIDEGIAIPDLVGQLDAKLEEGALFLSGGGGRLIKANINVRLEPPTCTDGIWKSYLKNPGEPYICLYDRGNLVSASGGEGSHSCHAMATRIQNRGCWSDPIKTVKCVNSWGCSMAEPEVPNSKWKNVKVYSLFVKNVQVCEGSGKPWTTITNRKPYVALTNPCDVMKPFHDCSKHGENIGRCMRDCCQICPGFYPKGQGKGPCRLPCRHKGRPSKERNALTYTKASRNGFCDVCGTTFSGGEVEFYKCTHCNRYDVCKSCHDQL